MDYTTMGLQVICQPDMEPTTGPIIALGQDTSAPVGGFFSRGPFWDAVSVASVAMSTYHGYKRNDSIGWALWWGLMGGLFPVITPVIAIAQGFGERE